MAPDTCSSSPVTRNRWFLFAVFVLVLTTSIYSEYWLGVITDHSIGGDLNIYVKALNKARVGANPYEPYSIGSSFLYHPFALSFLSFFTDPGVKPNQWPWAAASIVAWILAGQIALNAAWRPISSGRPHTPLRIAVLLLCILFAPFWETLHIGQINTFVALSLAVMFDSAESRREVLAGVALAIGIALKTSPAIFVLFFLITGRYRLLSATLATLMILSVIPCIQFGGGVISDYIKMLGAFRSDFHPSNYNESFTTLLFRLLKARGLEPKVAIMVWAQRVVDIAVIAWVSLRTITLTRSSLDTRIAFCAFNISMVIFSPIIWYHHNTLLLIPLIVLGVVGRGQALRWGALILLLMQAERLFEQYAVRLAIPMIVAHGMLLAVTLHLLFTRERDKSEITGITR